MENETKFTRVWRMLENIPRLPHEITINELYDKLRAEDFTISKRTIQRDLIELSRSGKWPLTTREEGNKYFWSFAANSSLMALPGLDIHTAVALKLVNKFITKMIPPATLKYLEPYFNSAGEKLKIVNEKLDNWTDKVGVVSNTPLLPPVIDPEIMEIVYDALFKDKMLKINHYQKGKEKPYSFTANPLGVVFRDYTIYLICTTDYNDYERVEYKPLHRIKSVGVIEESRTIPEGFNLEKFINQELNWKVSEKILNFKAEFNASVAYMMYETPLAEKQIITELENGNVIVEAKLPDTMQLRWWLLNMGESVRVIKPQNLFNEFKDISHIYNDMYIAN